MQASTISFTLKTSSGTSVTATVAYNSSTDIATLTPTAALAYGTTYVATVSGAEDTAGAAMPAVVSWSFTTAPKGTVPTVIGVSPSSGASGVAVPSAILDFSLTATFSEPVQPSTITMTLTNSSGTPVELTTNYSDATNTITGWPNANAIWTPGSPGTTSAPAGYTLLENSTTYVVTVSGATDAAGNAMSSFSWTFTTGPATAAIIPTVSRVSPDYNASSVDIGTPIAVNFNEAVLASSITASKFTLVSSSGAAVPATITYSDINTLHTATLTPTSALAFATTYMATISGVKDAAGNTMASPYTWSFTTASGSQTYTQLPLLYQSNLQYMGAFLVPHGGTEDQNSFNYNNEGVAYNPANNSLFLAGFGWNTNIGEIGIPSSIVNSTNINDLATASILQQPENNVFTMVPNVSNLLPGDSSGVCIGGLQVVNGQLIGTLWDYYDTTGATTATHFRFDSLNLSTATVEGMFQVGTNGLNAGFYDGYMGAIPAAWQSALGAPYITGSVTQNIVSRTSNGPAAFGFNPSTLSTSTPSTTIPYVYYPYTTPLGYPLVNGYTVTNPLFNGTTEISGVFFAPGSSTVLFFGSTGTNTMMYGTGSSANDSTYRGGGKGPHSVNGDYAYQVWAYNANDLLAVKDGQMQPWQVQPYATWNLDFPQSNPEAMLGVTFNALTNRLYVVEDGGQTGNYNYLPVVQVYQLTLSFTGGSGGGGVTNAALKPA